MEKYYITRYYLSLAVFIHLSYKIRKYCQPSFGYSWHKHTNTRAHTQRTNQKNPKLQVCFIFQLVKEHGNLTLAALWGVWCLGQVTGGWLGASSTGQPSQKIPIPVTKRGDAMLLVTQGFALCATAGGGARLSAAEHRISHCPMRGGSQLPIQTYLTYGKGCI